MLCIEIEEPGGPEVLKLRDRPIPVPADHEVLIRVTSAGVNRPDLLQRKGAYPPPPGASDLPGLEVAGEIVALGPKAALWRVGEPVCALLTGGGYAEYATAHEGSCLPVPKGLSLVEAAALPETFFTVYANVFDDARLTPGETILVHGGTSGVGVCAIAMAKAIGAKVIATASSEAKLEAIRGLGCDLALNYTDDGWVGAVAAFGGADVVLDMAGGDFVEKNLECLNPFGRHVSIAFLRGPIGQMNIFAVMRKRLRLTGSTMKSRDMADKARLAAGLRRDFWPHIEGGRIKPVLDRIFPLAEAAKAHERMEKGEHIGKIMLKVAD
ncbi:MAG: NAD(P)H-quinone oxidoreductase [Parvularculaceae bacterium]